MKIYFWVYIICHVQWYEYPGTGHIINETKGTMWERIKKMRSRVSEWVRMNEWKLDISRL